MKFSIEFNSYRILSVGEASRPSAHVQLRLFRSSNRLDRLITMTSSVCLTVQEVPALDLSAYQPKKFDPPSARAGAAEGGAARASRVDQSNDSRAATSARRRGERDSLARLVQASRELGLGLGAWGVVCLFGGVRWLLG